MSPARLWRVSRPACLSYGSRTTPRSIVIQFRVLGVTDKGEDGMGDIEEDIFLRQLENMLLNSVGL